jgi:hypothetical protein
MRGGIAPARQSSKMPSNQPTIIIYYEQGNIKLDAKAKLGQCSAVAVRRGVSA